LRRALDDSASSPRYIQTVPKRGYRLVAEVQAISSSAQSGEAAQDEPEAQGGAVEREPAPSALAAGSSTLYRLLPMLILVAFALVGSAYLWRDAPDLVSESATETVTTRTALPIIAVLPFTNMSDEVQMDYLGEGLAEEILNSLTRVDGLRVRSRTSSFALKDQQLGVGEIAQRLGISHLLDGSIRHAGDTLRISVQLIDLHTDTAVWSEIFEKPAQNVFELQGEIARSVTGALEIALDLHQKARLGDAGTTNPEAYQLYLQGRQLLARRTTLTLSTAIESFERALILDPGYARAYLGLADANLLLPLYNNAPGAHYMEKALVAVETALRLDPDLGEAYATLGSVRDELRDFVGAEEAFKMALKRAPRYPTTYHWYGFMLYRLARQEEAHQMLKLAVEYDPLSNPLQYGLGANLLAMGRQDEAEALYREILSSDPEFSWVYEAMAELSWNGRGQLGEAARWYQQAARYDPDSSYFPARLSAIYLDAGEAESVQLWLDKAFKLQPDSFDARIHRGLLYLYQGEAEQAYQLAMEVLEEDPANYLALFVARTRELLAGQYQQTRDRYASEFPELFELKPRLNTINFQMAVDLVPVLRQLGEQDLADRLLELSWEIARDYPRHGLPYRLSDVKILAMRGKTQAALERLEQAVESGWRPYWWLFMKYDPALEPLRREAAFQQLIRRLESEGLG
jgi:TolB-like protein/Tfp pilus assembly protein PilF